MSPLPNYSRGILREKGPEISPPGEGGRLVNGGRDSSQASWPPVQRIGFLFWIIESHSHYRSPPSDSPRHQIVGFLREAETGLPVKHLCRTHGFSEASYYLWRSKFGGMSVSDAGRARERVQQYRAVGLTRTSPVPLAELASQYLPTRLQLRQQLGPIRMVSNGAQGGCRTGRVWYWGRRSWGAAIKAREGSGGRVGGGRAVAARESVAHSSHIGPSAARLREPRIGGENID